MARKRFFISAALICIIPLVIIIMTYKKLSLINVIGLKNSDTNQETVIRDENKNMSNNKSDDIEDDNDEQGNEDITVDTPVTQIRTNNTTSELSETSNSDNNELESDLKSILSKAKEACDNTDYKLAENEYKKALELVNDDKTKAECYQNIAELNGKMHRYGTAIVNAQKAYNIAKTPERGLLIAKLYYKTGNQEKYTQMINSIMESDF